MLRGRRLVVHVIRVHLCLSVAPTLRWLRGRLASKSFGVGRFYVVQEMPNMVFTLGRSLLGYLSAVNINRFGAVFL